MPDRALVVGISNYPGDPLQGAVPEARRWMALLEDVYGFEPVTFLRECGASPQALKDELTALFSETRAGERRVFVFCGHGDIVPNRYGGEDEVLRLLYKKGEDKNTNVLSEAEFAEIVQKNPPNGAAFTIVLECCYAGGFEAFPLRVFGRVADFFGFTRSVLPLEWRRGRKRGRVPTFEKVLSSDNANDQPLIVAACEPRRLAIHLPVRSSSRRLGMRFSSAAIPELRKRPTLTPLQLMKRINPIDCENDPPQIAVLAGNTSRVNKHFFS